MIFNLLVLLILAFLVWGIVTYNRLVLSRSAFRKAFVQVEIQLQRRLGLTKKVLEAVKGRLEPEAEELQARLAELDAARNNLLEALRVAKENSNDPVVMDELVRAQEALEILQEQLPQALKDADPGLAVDAAVKPLITELSGSDERLAHVRQAYNDAVLAYNGKLEMFPANLLADSFDFQPAGTYDKVSVQTGEEKSEKSESFLGPF